MTRRGESLRTGSLRGVGCCDDSYVGRVQRLPDNGVVDVEFQRGVEDDLGKEGRPEKRCRRTDDVHEGVGDSKRADA